MKIVYITMWFPILAETFACEDVLALKRIGMNVSVHGLRPKPKYFKRLVKERGLETLLITHNTISASLKGLLVAVKRPAIALSLLLFTLRYAYRTLNFLLRSIVFIPRVLELFEYTKKEKPDIVHLFWGHYPALVGYLIKKYRPEIKLSMFLGAYDLVRLGCNYQVPAPVARQADVVWTHCRSNVPVILKVGVLPERLSVAYRGIDLSKISKNRNKIRHKIVSAGALIRSKAMHIVLEAFQKIVRDFPDASLVILGDGPERLRLEKHARNLRVEHSVSFRGHVSHDEVFDELSSAEVFLFMSKKPSERIPNVVKEAMASGCVCVVSKTQGINELISDGKNGFLVEYDDYEKTSDIVSEVFRSEKLCSIISKAARREINKNFDVNITMAMYVKKWNELCQFASDYR